LLALGVLFNSRSGTLGAVTSRLALLGRRPIDAVVLWAILGLAAGRLVGRFAPLVAPGGAVAEGVAWASSGGK